MAIIKGGTTGALAEVDTLPKAQRSILYDGAGQPISGNVSGLAAAELNVRQTAATGAGAIVFAIRNPSATKTIVIERLDLQLFFDGTSAATQMRYEFARYTAAAAALSGGAVVTPLQKRTSLGASVADVRVLDTGLTATGAVLQTVFYSQSCSRLAASATVAGATVVDIVDWTGINGHGVELAQNEMLAIRPRVVTVIGDNLIGMIGWREQ